MRHARQAWEWIGRWGVLLTLLWLALSAGRAVTLTQTIAHESPLFHPRAARLTLGRDGLVYVSAPGSDAQPGYLLCLSREGGRKSEQLLSDATLALAVNGQGVLAVATPLRTMLLSKPPTSRTTLAIRTQALEAGPSGDFYAADGLTSLLRVSPKGVRVATYPIPAGDGFRICEKVEACYLPGLRCIGFDGQERWASPLQGVWDVAEDGTVYLLEPGSTQVRTIRPDGTPGPALSLQMGEAPPTPEMAVTDLRVWENDLLLKRRAPAELFQLFDRTTGVRKRVVEIAHETLAVTFDSPHWTAGESVPLRIQLTGTAPPTPHWRVWARPVGTTAYREFSWDEGQVRVPADCGGMYVLKISPESAPQRRQTPADYQVQTLITIRQPATKGTLTVSTPGNRLGYGRGEEIPVELTVQCRPDERPAQVTFRLLTEERTLAERTLPVPADGRGRLSLTLSPALTAMLRPRTYLLSATAAGFTSVPQYLDLGPGGLARAYPELVARESGTRNVFSTGWEGTELGRQEADRLTALGMTLSLRGAGTFFDFLTGPAPRISLPPSPEEVGFDAFAEPASLVTVAELGARGIRVMPTLNALYASVEAGEGQMTRPPAHFIREMEEKTRALLAYPAFHGWQWWVNWWWPDAWRASGTRPGNVQLFVDALEETARTGLWSPVLDQATATVLRHTPEVIRRFDDALRQSAPGKKTMAMLPYEMLLACPPLAMAPLDGYLLGSATPETRTPDGKTLVLDVIQRGGKTVWVSLPADDGTGGSLASAVGQCLQRKVGGLEFPARLEEPDGEELRTTTWGGPSVTRALTTMLKQYGPWLESLERADPVAIVVSGRMSRFDRWGQGRGRHGRYLAHLMEAFHACQYAHYPAAFVLADDLTPDALTRYRVVLVVGQQVALEPALIGALDRARAAGTVVFADGSCRADVVRDLIPLGIAFSRLDAQALTGAGTTLWARSRTMADTVRPHLAELRAKLGTVLPPLATVDSPGVLLAEHRAGEGRVLFAVNTAVPEGDPTTWGRHGHCPPALKPVQATLTPAQPSPAIYDVLAWRALPLNQGRVTADLRALPVRIFTLLPAPIGQVVLRGPQAVMAGRPIEWAVSVQDPAGVALPASLPAHVRLLAGDGTLLEERAVAVRGAPGAAGTFTVPVNVPPGVLTLEATELCSGKVARLTLQVTPAHLSLDTVTVDGARKAEGEAVGTVGDAASQPVGARFGAHLREVAVLGNSLAVVNGMDVQENLYAVELTTGQVVWSQRIGHTYALAPQSFTGGVAVQGMDLTSAEGMHLYLVRADGLSERRFGAWGFARPAVPGLGTAHVATAIAPDAHWVAVAGELGLAVWSRDGRFLWRQPRAATLLATLDARTFLGVQGMMATAYDALSGRVRWRVPLGAEGVPRQVVVSADGSTCALLIAGGGGRIAVLRGGTLLRSYSAHGQEIALSPDGAWLAQTDGSQLKLYGVTTGLQWCYNGDDSLHMPRIARDGRIACSSELGILHVLDAQGRPLQVRDVGALATPTWLPDGDLLVATWMGRVLRLDGAFRERWQLALSPMRTERELLRRDATPTTRVPGLLNAEATAWPLTPNLLAAPGATLTAPRRPGYAETPLDRLVDGQPDTLQGWGTEKALNRDVGEGSEPAGIQLDLPRPARVTGVTLVEDPSAPGAWLREVRFDAWNTERASWVPVQECYSHALVHTHRFARPVEGTRFRLVPPDGAGALLGEIILHGEMVETEHPDVVAKRAVAVLFDEHPEVIKAFNSAPLLTAAPYAGQLALLIPGNQQLQGRLSTWNFPIVERPDLGQYRYLQLAWCPLEPGTDRLTIAVGGVLVVDETLELNPAALDTFTPAWRLVRVDLWQALKGEARLQALTVTAHGGALALDGLRLGRREEDLPGEAKGPD
jgi:outer membrane protein assembly factor BamB